MNITAHIITLNEEKHIAAVIASVRQVCDEVIVVDSMSSDRTCEIAESLGARVFRQPYLGDGPQKAFAVAEARHDWILSIDADERLSDGAVAAIRRLDLAGTGCPAYSFRRKTFVGRHFIRLWYPDRLVRLYHRGRSGYSDKKLHARVEAANPCALEADLLHYSYDDYLHMIRTSEKFIRHGALVALEKGRRARPWDPVGHGLAALFKALVLKGGMFHGRHGWHVAVISAFSSYMKYAVMRELQEDPQRDFSSPDLRE